jgi:hypothetical protein
MGYSHSLAFRLDGDLRRLDGIARPLHDARSRHHVWTLQRFGRQGFAVTWPKVSELYVVVCALLHVPSPRPKKPPLYNL